MSATRSFCSLPPVVSILALSIFATFVIVIFSDSRKSNVSIVAPIAAVANVPGVAPSTDRVATLTRLAAGMARSEDELRSRVAADIAIMAYQDEATAIECRAWLEPKGDRPLRFTSQFGQDSTLLALYAGAGAAHAAHVYVDVGANDPRALSNTWFLDKCLGWRGVCIEANPELAASLRKKRSCVVVNKCASESTLELNFVPQGVGGHILGATSNDGKARAIQVPCAPLESILRDAEINRVDFLTIDIEGSEIPALRNFPWDTLPVDTLLIESNWASKELDFLISDAGFWKVSDIGTSGCPKCRFEKGRQLTVTPIFSSSGFNDDLYIRGPRILKAPGWDKARRDSWEWQQKHERERGICIKRDGML
jgi:FkbM family methyltransferase